MVTCADSQVRILDGLNVIGKYKSMFLCPILTFMKNFPQFSTDVQQYILLSFNRLFFYSIFLVNLNAAMIA